MKQLGEAVNVLSPSLTFQSRLQRAEAAEDEEKYAIASLFHVFLFDLYMVAFTM